MIVLFAKIGISVNINMRKWPLCVREMLEIYPEPKPHFNTIATLVRILEEKGYVGHEKFGNSHRFYAIAQKSDFSRRSF